MRRAFVASIVTLALATASLSFPFPAGAQSPDEIFAADIRNLRDRFAELAALLPSEHYGWRPSPGARSVSELFMHVASSTYFHMQHLGIPIPKGSFHGHRSLEVVADKDSVKKILGEAFEHAVGSLEKADTSFAGRHSMATHLHEHLGQAITYTRSLQLTPPWAETR